MGPNYNLCKRIQNFGPSYNLPKLKDKILNLPIQKSKAQGLGYGMGRC